MHNPHEMHSNDFDWKRPDLLNFPPKPGGHRDALKHKWHPNCSVDFMWRHFTERENKPEWGESCWRGQSVNLPSSSSLSVSRLNKQRIFFFHSGPVAANLKDEHDRFHQVWDRSYPGARLMETCHLSYHFCLCWKVTATSCYCYSYCSMLKNIQYAIPVSLTLFPVYLHWRLNTGKKLESFLDS